MKVEFTITDVLTFESKLAPVRSVSFGKNFSKIIAENLQLVEDAGGWAKMEFEKLPEVVAYNEVLKNTKEKVFVAYPKNDYAKNIKIMEDAAQKTPEFAAYVKVNEEAQKKTVMVDLIDLDFGDVPDNISADQYRAISKLISFPGKKPTKA